MDKLLIEKALTFRDCLRHLKTKPERARRQHLNSHVEDPLEMHDPFASDEVKILSSKAFRNMGYKTQVATAPTNTNIRTRMSHTHEVVSCSVVIADLLGLNTSLARAIALGHDIGHVPFGHQGEQYLAQAMGLASFCHEVMAPIIAQKIERRGRGLNLSFQTLEGMMGHSGDMAKEGMMPEAWVVRYADKFAYLFHDYNDFMRVRYQVKPELASLMNEFGENQRARTNTAICGLMIESAACGKVCFDESELAVKFKRIRTLMYEVYKCVASQDPRKIMEPVLSYLAKLRPGSEFLLLSLMTDKDVIFLAQQPLITYEHIGQTAIAEIIPYLDEIGPVDLCNPDLNW